MSDITVSRRAAVNPFQAGAIALMLALGIVGFVGLLLLGAYAPDLRSGRDGGAHALSNAATGYSAIVELARATGRNPRITRSAYDFDTEDLLVVAPESAAIDMTEVLTRRVAKPTLIVLPKWLTRPDRRRNGWVNWIDLQPLYQPKGVLAPDIDFAMAQYRSPGAPLITHGLPSSIRLRAPRPIQVITGLEKPGATDRRAVQGERSEQPAQPSIKALITDSRGGIVLAQIDDRPLFVLADPDLIANRGMRDVRQAASVLALLDWLNSNPPESIAFDVSLNGFGHSRSPLKLLFEAPFVVVTVCIALALLLAGIQAFGRFGPPRARERAIAFGKAALVDNSAMLVRKAGRESGMGRRYAAMIRERAAILFGIPPRVRDGALDQALDQLHGKRRFTELAEAAAAAEDRDSLLAAAHALHIWQKEKNG